MPIKPALVAHADWGSSAQKRSLAIACRTGSQDYHVLPLRMVNVPGLLFEELVAEADPPGSLLVGFDFPIGLPLYYAKRVGVQHFPTFLKESGKGGWANFYQVANTPEEISPQRPFYPGKAGTSKQSHLLQALGASSMDVLRRRCERAYVDEFGVNHRAACPLFWTMGGQQVGKAAILGWKEVLTPVLLSPSGALLWPFDGDLEELIGSKRPVIVETYPAEFYHHLEVRFSPHQRGVKSGKRVPKDRADNAARLLDRADALHIEIDASLKADLISGFGKSTNGDDRFDAFTGLLGMLNILLGNHSCETPKDEPTRRVEGWIMGKNVSRKE